MKFDDGILIANLIPFDEDLEIDWPALRSLSQRLKGIEGIRGFVVNAFAGEGPTLTDDERIRVIECHREIASPDQPVVATVYGSSTAGAVGQARAAKAAGADALLICPPVVSAWNATVSPHIAKAYHGAIADAVDLPIILFQLYGDPGSYSHELLLDMAASIDTVFAVKMAQANDAVRYDRDFLALKALSKPILTLPAVGSSMFHALNTGADGLLTGLATFAPFEMAALWQATKSGDFEKRRALHFQLAPINHMIYGAPYVDLHTRYKELAHMAGAIPSARVRGPQVPVSADERSALKAALTKANLQPLPHGQH